MLQNDATLSALSKMSLYHVSLTQNVAAEFRVTRSGLCARHKREPHTRRNFGPYNAAKPYAENNIYKIATTIKNRSKETKLGSGVLSSPAHAGRWFR